MEILLSFVAAIVGGVIFTIIGIVPGTDETATMVPLTLVLVLLGASPVVIFSWFIGIATAMQISHTIPTAMAALPGSTMAVPMVFGCSIAKRLGAPHMAMRKMAAGSLIGSIIAIPVATAFGIALAPFGKQIAPYAPFLFTVGAVILALMSKAKWGAVLAIIPYSFLIQGLQKVAQASVNKTLFISIFMGITVGPMVAEVFNTTIPKIRAKQMRHSMNEVWLAPEIQKYSGLFPNPFKILTKKQNIFVSIASALSACTFTFSPAGMTVLLGEIFGARCKEVYDRSTTTIAVMDAVSNATYLGEVIVPLLAFGLPLSPMGLGPAAPLFNAPPRFTVNPIHNLHNYLAPWQYIVFGYIGMIGGALIAYPVAIKYARKGTELLFKLVSHEALIGSFVGLIIMLAYYEAGIVGVAVALTIALFGGILHNYFDIHTGVQFMGYYASGWIVSQILRLVTK
ncbi:MAG TPA: tripartite tricarboxylate transporter permease [Firmicutes bacterium]|nr:tripartite tricarboxylate transporter permease [Bacillota bacterium]